jgi:hypothetical protein
MGVCSGDHPIEGQGHDETADIILPVNPPQPAARLRHDRVHGSLKALADPDALRR